MAFSVDKMLNKVYKQNLDQYPEDMRPDPYDYFYTGPDGRIYQCQSEQDALDDEYNWALSADPEKFQPECRKTDFRTKTNPSGVMFPYDKKDLYRIDESLGDRNLGVRPYDKEVWR